MNKKIIIYYFVFCILILTTLIYSMFILKKAEQDNNEKNIEKKINEIIEYNTKNSLPKNIKLKLTNNGEIITIDIDEYLKGVVPSEMPPSYDIEALKAQAVVARTYAYEKILRASHIDCDICDSYSCCQAYYSKEKLIEIWKNKGYDDATINEYFNKVDEAVNSTNNIVITYKGQIIKAYFHANSGGKTEDVSEIWGKQSIPYLISVESLGEENHKYYKTEVTFTKEELIEKLNKGSDNKCTNIDEIKILEYTLSGRVRKIQIGEDIYEATLLRTILMLKSTNFNVSIDGNNVTFNVTGYGHGIGMSQTGSDYYAKNGYTYDEIIKHYYTGVDIATVKNCIKEEN